MDGAKLTVIFPLYHAESKVLALVQSLAAQMHPHFKHQNEWLEVIFIDNCSPDKTVSNLRQAIEAHYSNQNVQIIENETNMGLSMSLNRAFKLAKTPYALTCHSDCLFAQSDYLSRMIELMDHNPSAAAITGLPSIDPEIEISLTEKINLTTNLMDIFTPTEETELVPTGFAEGRCDIFRIGALKQVGFYDTALKLAGEDQVLAGRLRDQGYEIYQAAFLKYRLSLSAQQDTIGKLISHQRLFGRAHPYILIHANNTHPGVVGKRAGRNRRARTKLRGLQLLSSGIYGFFLLGFILGLPPLLWAAPLVVSFLAKTALFWRHMRELKLSPRHLCVLFALQPVLDLSYTLGVMQGLKFLATSSRNGARQIG